MRVTRQGEVTIPQEIMDAAGLAPGAEVTWEVGPDGVVRLLPMTGAVPEPVPPPAGQTADDPLQGPKRAAEFEAWLESIRGTATGGLTTDEIMALTRGE